MEHDIQFTLQVDEKYKHLHLNQLSKNGRKKRKAFGKQVGEEDKRENKREITNSKQDETYHITKMTIHGFN